MVVCMHLHIFMKNIFKQYIYIVIHKSKHPKTLSSNLHVFMGKLLWLGFSPNRPGSTVLP